MSAAAPFEWRFTLSAQEHATAFAELFRPRWWQFIAVLGAGAPPTGAAGRARYLLLAATLAGAVVLLLVWGLAHLIFEGFLLALLGLWIGGIWIAFVRSRRRARETFARSPALQGRQEWTIDAAGVRVQYVDHASRLAWSDFTLVEETPSAFAFVVDELRTGYLPKRLFATDEGMQALRLLVRERLGVKAALRA